MVLWILIMLLVAAVAVGGYYQGGIRAGMTLIGLILGALLALPLAGATHGILALCGVKHPLAQSFLGPLLVLVVITLLFKGVSFWVHSKVQVHFKYRAEDGLRVRWERLNQQLGLCLGVANGVLLAGILSIFVFVLGYFTVQVATPDKDPWYLKLVNACARGMDQSGLQRALAPFTPASELYYNAADVLGLLHQSPQLQNRLSRYPLLLPLSEEDRFQELGSDKNFRDFWKGKPSFQEFLAHDRIKPLAADPAFYQSTLDLLKDNLPDLKTYLETGRAPAYADRPLVDRWHFNLAASYNLARRLKPNMTVAERKFLRSLYQTVWDKASLTAFLDETVLVKNKTRTGKDQSVRGRWKHAYGSKYLVTLREGNNWDEFEAVVETNSLTLIQDKLALYFDN